jgi:ubiquinone/menaquinone biosynthesis C-methylase UbiE
MADPLSDHYGGGYEAERLSSGPGRLEFERSLDVLGRFLPAPPARILDVGGGPGAYACALAERGYTVTLVDYVPLHVELASRAFAERGLTSRAAARQGDARSLSEPDSGADAVLLMGPLYHLTEREDRLRALREAGRVLKKGGRVIAAAVSRYASTFDGLRQDYLADPAFVEIVKGDLRDGRHRNPTGNPAYFTDTYFHRPEDLRLELTESSFRVEALIGVEGPAWLLADVDERLKDPGKRERLLKALAAVEEAPSLLGVSAHLLAVAAKEPGTR